MHNQGRLYLEKVFGSDIVTDFIENVPEGAEAESVFRGYAKEVTISFSEQVSATWTAW
jgi:basic membrane protein A